MRVDGRESGRVRDKNPSIVLFREILTLIIMYNALSPLAIVLMSSFVHSNRPTVIVFFSMGEFAAAGQL